MGIHFLGIYGLTGAGQGNLTPFVTRIDNFIAIEGHVISSCLLSVYFPGDEIASLIAIEDIEFCIVDQMENLVILAEEDIITDWPFLWIKVGLA